MRRFAALALLCTSSLCLAQTEQFEFKGIALNSDISAVEANSRFQCKDLKSSLADMVCDLRYGEEETIAGARIRILSLLYYDGKLHTIVIGFGSNEFDMVADALKEKYGAADLKTEIIQNRAGATFENNILTWRKPGATLTAKRYIGTIDRSTVNFISDSALEDYKRRRDSSAKSRAKDL